MPIRILAIGKRHESWVVEGIIRYEKRLKRLFAVEWVLLPHSHREGTAARQDESEKLLTHIRADEFVVLLDERGEILDSPQLSFLLKDALEKSRKIVVIIGGSYGVDASIHERADRVWSLSRLVFPHQLVRLLLVEQLYRSQEISEGRPYHHV